MFATSRLVTRRVLLQTSGQNFYQQFQTSLYCQRSYTALVSLPQLSSSSSSAAAAATTTVIPAGKNSTFFNLLLVDGFNFWTWLIKRTFQPSIIRKKRKCGYLKRSKSAGGRKILRRRREKGRSRLFGA